MSRFRCESRRLGGLFPSLRSVYLLTCPGVFHFPFSVRNLLAASFRGIAARATELRSLLLQNKAIHAVQEVAGKLEHLLGGGGTLRRTATEPLADLAHLVHRPHNGLPA